MSPSSGLRNDRPRQQRRRRREDRRALRRRAQDRLEQVDDLGLLGVERDARRARAPRPARRDRRAAASPSAASPRRSRPGCRTRRTTTAPTWKVWRASPAKSTSTGTSGARCSAVGAVTGRGDEEVQQHRLLAGARDEHVAAGAGPAQQRLGDPRRQHRRDGGVDRVAAVAQHAAPACAVSGWPAATMPWAGRSRRRRG